MENAAPNFSYETPYERWAKAQGVPIVEGHYVSSLHDVKLEPWERLGVAGAIIQHDGTAKSNDCHLIELRPGQSSRPEHHLHEETVYVLSGHGSTTVWREGGNSHSFEWKPGSLFAIPLNMWHEFHNGTGTEAARLICVTSLPVTLNLFGNDDFIYNNPYQFADRFGDNADFSGDGELDGRVWSTNFISDVANMKLLDYHERGAGGKNIRLRLANNIMGNHISEFPVGTYKKGHRHGPGAHVIVLSGQGYSLMWKEGEPIKRYDWQPGTLVIPPDRWFHQHFNTGTTPARYLAMRFSSNAPKGKGSQLPKGSFSIKQGGDQIDYDDEDPAVQQIFREALAKTGAPFGMDSFFSNKQ